VTAVVNHLKTLDEYCPLRVNIACPSDLFRVWLASRSVPGMSNDALKCPAKCRQRAVSQPQRDGFVG
jgi:hypothetical protein